jgi:hypothetical protein
MLWDYDQEFDYPNGKKPLVVEWNLDEGEIEITSVKFPDGNLVDGDYMWDNHYILTEDIMSYIDNEFLTSEDFWLTKAGYDF